MRPEIVVVRDDDARHSLQNAAAVAVGGGVWGGGEGGGGAGGGEEGEARGGRGGVGGVMGGVMGGVSIITLFELENDARMCLSIAEGGGAGGGGGLPWGDVLPTQVANVFVFPWVFHVCCKVSYICKCYVCVRRVQVHLFFILFLIYFYFFKQVSHVCFTSGSSGRPKGCVITHASLASYAAAKAGFFAVHPDSSGSGKFWKVSMYIIYCHLNSIKYNIKSVYI